MATLAERPGIFLLLELHYAVQLVRGANPRSRGTDEAVRYASFAWRLGWVPHRKDGLAPRVQRHRLVGADDHPLPAFVCELNT